MEGEVSIVSLQDDMNIIKHENIVGHLHSNVAYIGHCVKTRPEEAGTFIVGSENKLAIKYKFDMKDYEVEKQG